MSAASDNLRNSQEQADFDGTMVRVSRQAVEETLAEYDAMLAALRTIGGVLSNRKQTGHDDELWAAYSGTYIPADTRRPSGLGRSEKTGVIEFTGSLADLEQAVGLRIEREGQAFRVVPLEGTYIPADTEAKNGSSDFATALRDAFERNELDKVRAESDPPELPPVESRVTIEASRRFVVDHLRKSRLLSPPRFLAWRLCWDLEWRLNRLATWLGP